MSQVRLLGDKVSDEPSRGNRIRLPLIDSIAGYETFMLLLHGRTRHSRLNWLTRFSLQFSRSISTMVPSEQALLTHQMGVMNMDEDPPTARRRQLAQTS